MIINKTIEIGAPVEVAWSTWVDRMIDWWPYGTHSVGGDAVRSLVVEPKVGGRVYEVLDDGTEHDWGLISVFDPPKRLVQSWHPGTDPSTATELEVRFAGIGDGSRTRFELEHRGWERHPMGERMAQGYAVGWDFVLQEFPAIAVRT